MWTEQIGFVAANATLEKLKKNKINKSNIKIGLKIKKIYSMKVLNLDHVHHMVYQKQLVCGL